MNIYTLFQSKQGLLCCLLFSCLTITSIPAFGLSVFINCSDTSFVAYGDPLNPMADQCVGEAQLHPQISSDCAPSDGLWIDYKVDWYDDGQYDLLGYSDNQGGYPFANPDSLSVRTFSADLPQADGYYPVGRHRMVWTARDSCGAVDSCAYHFEMIDGVAPIAGPCPGVLSIPPDWSRPGPERWVIPAREVNLYSSDNCSAAENLRFSFSLNPDDTVRIYPATVIQCIQYDTFYVWDEAGNYSSQLVAFLLMSCDGYSPPLYGRIRTEDREELPDVAVHVNAGEDTLYTDANGYYELKHYVIYDPYEFVPQYNGNPTNGVSTFDLLLISRHILGISALPSPYRIIAADVNRSGSVTTFDMLSLRKLLLGIDTTFRENTSWRFILGDYQFPNPPNPFVEDFPEFFYTPSLTERKWVDFTAVKVGDVNGSAAPQLKSSSNRHSAVFPQSIFIEDQWLRANEESTIILYTHYLEQALGIQLALSFSPDVISIQDAVPGTLPAMTTENLGTSQLAEGLLLLSWHQAEAQTLKSAPLLKLKICSQQDVRLSEVLRLSPQVLSPEAYSVDAAGALQAQPLQLQFRTTLSFRDCRDTIFLAFGHPSDPNADQCLGQIELQPGILSDCGPTSGLLIDYKIDLNDDGQYDLLGYSDNQGPSYPYPNPAGLPVRTFDAAQPQADGIYPVGQHRIVWMVQDSCGKRSTCDHLFELTDAVPPQPFCETSTITIPIGSFGCVNHGGHTDIFASDFNLGSTDNCTTPEALHFSFTADPMDTVRRLRCEDAGVLINYTIHVWDQAGNFNTCAVAVIANDCGGRPDCYAGEIYTESGLSIREVSVRLEGESQRDTILTDEYGQFYFQFTERGEYQVFMDKKDDPLNGVSTFDLLQISRHILDIMPFDSPYKRIAADVNASGAITTFDLVEARKVILGVEATFPDSASWRFINAAYPHDTLQLPPKDAFANPERIYYNDFTIQEQYVGIKVGDVTGNVDPQADMISFNLPDTWLRAGEEYTIPVYASTAKHWYGFQLALEVEGVKLLAVQPGALPEMGPEQYRLEERGLRMSWYLPEGVQLVRETPLFYLRLRSERTQLLSQILHLSPMLAAETYLGEADSIALHDLELHFGSNGLSVQRLLPQFITTQKMAFSQSEGPFQPMSRKQKEHTLFALRGLYLTNYRPKRGKNDHLIDQNIKLLSAQCSYTL